MFWAAAANDRTALASTRPARIVKLMVSPGNGFVGCEVDVVGRRFSGDSAGPGRPGEPGLRDALQPASIATNCRSEGMSRGASRASAGLIGSRSEYPCPQRRGRLHALLVPDHRTPSG